VVTALVGVGKKAASRERKLSRGARSVLVGVQVCSWKEEREFRGKVCTAPRLDPGDTPTCNSWKAYVRSKGDRPLQEEALLWHLELTLRSSKRFELRGPG
jgi:hypothetical protein